MAMNPLLPLLLLAGAYLIGSIPFSYLIARAIGGNDLRQSGSGNVGATNVMRTSGKLPGIAALFLDLAKGFGVAAIASHLVTRPEWPYKYVVDGGLANSPSFWVGLASVIAVLAHMYPVWLKFHGGKGVATAAGVFLALDPRALAAALIVFAIVLLISKYVSLASMSAAASLPIFVRFISQPPMWITIAAVVIGLAVVVKHHTNIARLAEGTERKFPR
jgi:acyl phosphate:glycerol-3-phosphate acyltransferase